ncbi:ribonuclease H-like domain-containing protein, partial [Tanacetum coccineum]
MPRSVVFVYLQTMILDYSCFGLIHHSSLPTLMLTGQVVRLRVGLLHDTVFFLVITSWTGSPEPRTALSRSSAELHTAARMLELRLLGFRNRPHELQTPAAPSATLDNVSAVYMSANPVQHQRTKHIKIDIHFVRNKVAAGHIQFERPQISRSNCGGVLEHISILEYTTRSRGLHPLAGSKDCAPLRGQGAEPLAGVEGGRPSLGSGGNDPTQTVYLVLQ